MSSDDLNAFLTPEKLSALSDRIEDMPDGMDEIPASAMEQMAICAALNILSDLIAKGRVVVTAEMVGRAQ